MYNLNKLKKQQQRQQQQKKKARYTIWMWGNEKVSKMTDKITVNKNNKKRCTRTSDENYCAPKIQVNQTFFV